MHAFIAGATGLVGSECLKLLLDRYESVTALVRRSLGVQHARLTEVHDFENLKTTYLPPGSHVFCALGTTIKKAGSQQAFLKVDYEYPLALAIATSRCADARFVLVSSVDANPESRNFYLRTKGTLERAISDLGLACHIMRPSFLIGDRHEFRPAERLGILLARTFQFLLAGSLRRYRPIHAKTVARAMVAAAQTNPSLRSYDYDHIRALADDLK